MDRETGREAEIEITDGMCEAGLKAVIPSECFDEVAAYSCFKAMVLAEPKYVHALLVAGLLRRRD